MVQQVQLSPIRQRFEELRNDPLLTSAAASSVLGVSPWTFRRWARLGQVRTYRIASRLRVRQSEVLRLIDEGMNGDKSNESKV